MSKHPHAPSSEPVAKFIETCVGGKIAVHGVEIPSFPIGTMYDEAKQKIVGAINAAARPTITLSAAEVGQVLSALISGSALGRFQMVAGIKPNVAEANKMLEEIEAAIALIEKVQP